MPLPVTKRLTQYQIPIYSSGHRFVSSASVEMTLSSSPSISELHPGIETWTFNLFQTDNLMKCTHTIDVVIYITMHVVLKKYIFTIFVKFLSECFRTLRTLRTDNGH